VHDTSVHVPALADAGSASAAVDAINASIAKPIARPRPRLAAARVTLSNPVRRGRTTTRLPRWRAQHSVPTPGGGGLT
jgi:hypothetical protein